MRENRSSGSVEGVTSNRDPYSDCADFSSRTKVAEPQVFPTSEPIAGKSRTFYE